MVGFLDEAYLWIKALHIIAVIAWMAGMLYLPRLFIYHCCAPSSTRPWCWPGSWDWPW
jgi:putative membrane protein